MGLETYRRKRRFKSTPEPSGKASPVATGDSFVVQKHAARRLHYDFRLEIDGVLKSWAVAKGPSLVPGEKRLAVRVEDHPLDYGDFEGTIPKGEYGGGDVIVWDRGRWIPIGDAAAGYAKGHLDFELQGEKLRGRWHLVRMAGKPREKRENWLLIKGDDAEARPDGPDILDQRPESVKSGRLVEDLAGEAPGWSSRTGTIEHPEPSQTSPPPDPSAVTGARQGPLPSFVEPELATLASKAPATRRWLHEIKFDGYRLQARIESGRVRLLTRSGLDWTTKFGDAMANALKALPAETALIDGELVVENASGVSDFSALQADLSEGRGDRFRFYAFDLLYLNGYDVRAAPLVERKSLLETLLRGQSGVLRFSESFDEEGALVLRHACRLSLEGVVSKLRDSPYRSGRGKDWVKSKCSDRQEFVVAGYVPSTTSAQAIGSLVLGYYDDGRLVHAGRVGTGYTVKTAEELYRRLDPMRIPSSPFAERLTADAARDVRYVRPELVAEIEFRGWTAERSLRHAAFRGLREDKPAEDVAREATDDPAPPKPRPAVKLTHPNRLYWPDVGVTKEGLANYYVEVWRLMAAFVVGRPLALVRCPSGFAGQCFFQKHAWQGLNRGIRLARDPHDASGEPILAIDDLDGLIALVQAGVLEIHPWGSSLATLEQPDMIIMDLDPAEDVAWPDVIAAAEEIRDRLGRLGLSGFVKTSGGRGLHVVAPLAPRAEWDEVKCFTKRLAEAMVADAPDCFVAIVTKSRRRGKILVDYLRNGRGATAVAPYSTRARAGAPVSMPLGWDELSPAIGPDYFTVINAPARLTRIGGDPWADFRAHAVPLPRRSDLRSRPAA